MGRASSNAGFSVTNMTYATSSPGATTGGQGNTPVSIIFSVLSPCLSSPSPFVLLRCPVRPALLSAAPGADAVLAPVFPLRSRARLCTTRFSFPYRARQSNLSRSYQHRTSTLSVRPHHLASSLSPSHPLSPSLLPSQHNGDRID